MPTRIGAICTTTSWEHNGGGSPATILGFIHLEQRRYNPMDSNTAPTSAATERMMITAA
uniref:Uncharacterized protein B1642C07.42 n=1 Tax=Oryza sativa subsp. japonica TaxID=39947 RepID=Q5F1Y0_ORYSJ|nr:hypothetical protein [Oryza sativa Japonica Group]